MRVVPRGARGFAVYGLMLAGLAFLLPPLSIAQAAPLFFSVGALAAWRYSWAALNFLRGNYYNRLAFPRLRKQADNSALMPPKIYLLLTVYRVDSETVAQVMSAAAREAIECGVPVNIVASIVEFSDEVLIRHVFSALQPPERVTLTLLRLPGQGKREALAQGFRAIARDMPPAGSVVALIDGDTLLTPEILRACAPFFALNDNLGALTTDEVCNIEGSAWMRAWHNLRFAQRHILMGSLALSKRVMTLTGRFSMYRADIITNPDFIRHMTEDHLDHWLLGKVPFLTGDDKSSLYWVLKHGYEQLYVPDAHIVTLEEPPSSNFFAATSRLMFRWQGNMLRTNARVLALGPIKMPLFVWWAFLDQRLSMWTTLCGPLFALLIAAQAGAHVIFYYLAWVAFTRWLVALSLLSARPVLDWKYPFLLYYNQVYGSLLKTWALFRPDRQRWARQKIEGQRSAARWADLGSNAGHALAFALLICAVGWAAHFFAFPGVFAP